MYVNASGKTVYAEDISCIVETRSSQGSIFIGNLEAAENLNTLKSTHELMQNFKSKLC